MFDLYTKCIARSLQNPEFKDIEAVRKGFLNNNQEIEIQDFGAGSSRMAEKRRRVNEIAKFSVSDKKKCELLFRLADYFKPENILELGTSLGISTRYLKLGSSNSKITSIEGDKTIHELAKSHLPSDIKLINSKFDEVLDEMVSEGVYQDFIFIDGDHRRESLLNQIVKLKSITNQNSVFILDDIYWSKDMSRAWKKLISDSHFGISVDLYHFGLLFPRQKQPKQHFNLRF